MPCVFDVCGQMHIYMYIYIYLHTHVPEHVCSMYITIIRGKKGN